jgi:hypothetical protein
MTQAGKEKRSDRPDGEDPRSWRYARQRAKAWDHVYISLVGKMDLVTCKICQAEQQLNDQSADEAVILKAGKITQKRPLTRLSVLLAFTRVHYYKHKLYKKDELFISKNNS